jgi:hypothetical protein
MNVLHLGDEDLTVEGALGGVQTAAQGMKLFFEPIGVGLAVNADTKRRGQEPIILWARHDGTSLTWTPADRLGGEHPAAASLTGS